MTQEERNKLQKIISTFINLSEMIPEFDVKRNGEETTQQFLEYISNEITIQNLSLIEILHSEVLKKEDE